MLRLVLISTLLLGGAAIHGADVHASDEAGQFYSLSSNRATGSIDRVDAALEVAGKVEVIDENTELHPLKLAVLANVKYDERSLTVPVSPKAMLRSVRHYNRAIAAIEIDENESQPTLHDDHRLVMSEVDEKKSTLFCLTGPLAHDELDLIDLPANTLLLDRLLPPNRVAIGKSWSHTDELMGALLGLDAVSDNKTASAVTSVKDSVALVEMSGTVAGAVSGAATEIELRGKYQFNLVLKRITWFGLLIREKRSVGHVAPGLEVTARLQVKIEPVEDSPELTDAALAGLPLERTADSTWLTYASPQGGWQLLNDRRWFVTRDEAESAVLRMVDQGNLIAQCNISTMPTIKPDKLASLSDFQEDIEAGLGEAFGQFVSARQEVNDSGYRVFRVVVEGTASEVPIQWTYYLLADQTGRQLVVVFLVESEMAERLAGTDEQLVSSVQFVDEKTALRPTPAAR